MMTREERLQLLADMCRKHGQAEVARRIGKSDSAVSQILSGSYQANPDGILQRVEEVFGTTVVACPVLGNILLGVCAEKRKLPFAATNPRRVQLYAACQNCKERGVL
jgi:transcriptional regulator with XRE-family HTH domain